MDLKKLVTEHYQLILLCVFFILSLFVITVKSYFTERGKLRAQISENIKLTEQAESIKAKFSRELEELKRDHQLEISRRKYQYESKKEEYLKFFKLLDEFGSQDPEKTQRKFIPILNDFNRNYLTANYENNKKNENNAVIVFQKKIQQLMFDSNKELVRIKQETNTIRLVASDKIVQRLDLLTVAYDRSLEASNKMMNNLPTLMREQKLDKMEANKRELEICAIMIDEIKQEIINLMRQELSEI